jgi:hypothetical protein
MTQRFPSAGRGGDTCTQVRLAESEFVAIDRCSCGTLRVHLGALTLRVSAEALEQVMQTLDQALLANAGMPEPRAPLLATAVGSARKIPRGQS